MYIRAEDERTKGKRGGKRRPAEDQTRQRDEGAGEERKVKREDKSMMR